VRGGTTTAEFGPDATQVDVLAAAAGAAEPGESDAESRAADAEPRAADTEPPAAGVVATGTGIVPAETGRSAE